MFNPQRLMFVRQDGTTPSSPTLRERLRRQLGTDRPLDKRPCSPAETLRTEGGQQNPQPTIVPLDQLTQMTPDQMLMQPNPQEANIPPGGMMPRPRDSVPCGCIPTGAASYCVPNCPPLGGLALGVGPGAAVPGPVGGGGNLGPSAAERDILERAGYGGGGDIFYEGLIRLRCGVLNQSASIVNANPCVIAARAAGYL